MPEHNNSYYSVGGNIENLFAYSDVYTVSGLSSSKELEANKGDIFFVVSQQGNGNRPSIGDNYIKCLSGGEMLVDIADILYGNNSNGYRSAIAVIKATDTIINIQWHTGYTANVHVLRCSQYPID